MSGSVRPRVLIVEDNPGDVFLFQECVRDRDVEVEVVVANEVDEGIRLLGPGQGPLPCLALIDLHMPKRDGKHLLTHLREHPELAAIPVVVLSSSNRPTDREACLQLGARDFLTKPSDWNGYCALIAGLRGYWSSI